MKNTKRGSYEPISRILIPFNLIYGSRALAKDQLAVAKDQFTF